VPDAFDLRELLERRRTSGRAWLEFLRSEALSMGVYALSAGAADPQGPHAEDEVYYVVSGRAMLRVGDEDHPAAAGAILFVGAHAVHRFHRIEEDLTALVFFAPPEGTARGRA
jgi:mannose-6-phosphate isomerase-like protein (cupin superfamily)